MFKLNKPNQKTLSLALFFCALITFILTVLVWQLFLSHQRALSELESIVVTYSELDRLHDLNVEVEELRKFSIVSSNISSFSTTRFLSLYDDIQAEMDSLTLIATEEEQHLLRQMAEEIQGYRETFLEAVDSKSITEQIINRDLNHIAQNISNLLQASASNDNQNSLVQLTQLIEVTSLNLTAYAYNASSVRVESILGSIEFIRQQLQSSSLSQEDKVTILNNLDDYQGLVNQVISQTQNYLYLSNVVLAGHASEYIYLAEELHLMGHSQFDEASELARAQLRLARKNTLLLSIALFFAIIGSLFALGYFLYRLSYVEKALKEISHRHKQIIDQANTGIAQVGLDGSWIEVNEKLCEIFGYTEEELTSLTWQEITHPDDLSIDSDLVQRIIDGEINEYTLDKRYFRKDGSTFWARLEVSGHKNEEGQLTNFISTIESIDDLKQQEGLLIEQLEVRLEALERSNAELEQFAYVASHDLQEPLRMVSSYMQLVEERYKEKLDDDGKEFIDYAVNGAIRMQALIKSLLEYSRVGTDKGMHDIVSMESVLDSAKENLINQIDTTEAVISLDPLPKVHGNKSQLIQLVQNLLSNAIKYRAPDKAPEIHISATKQENEPGWVFSVRDNGIGFDQAHADKIFVIFRRLHTKEEYAGTGIGLAICKKIAERHNGRIWVESLPGAGSTFYFTINTEEVQ